MERIKDRIVTFKSTEKSGLIPSQIIYVEGSYNKTTNNFIEQNFEKITDAFKKRAFDFVYIPIVIDDFNQSPSLEVWDLINYCYPYLNLAPSNLYFQNRFENNIVHQLFSTFGYKEEICPGLLRLIDDSETDCFTFEYFKFNLSLEHNLWSQINDYLKSFTPETKDHTFTAVEDYKVPAQKREKFTLDLIERLSKILFEESSSSIFEEKENKSEKEEEPAGHEEKPLEKKPLADIEKNTKDDSVRQAAVEKLDQETVFYSSYSGSFEECRSPRIEDAPIENVQKEDARLKDFDIVQKYYDIPKSLMQIDSKKAYNFIEKMNSLIFEAQELGIYEGILRDAFKTLAKGMGMDIDGKMKISRLVIDSEYNIYLPDYKEEVFISALPKSVFILFLRHPEGIVLKDLPDHERELMIIYKIISNRENMENMEDSVKEICSPYENSIHEKLSRIRAAFVNKISESYAAFYYVAGNRGEKKQIKLDRTMVSLPKELSLQYYSTSL